MSHVQEPGNGANLLKRLLLGSTGFSACLLCDRKKLTRNVSYVFFIQRFYISTRFQFFSFSNFTSRTDNTCFLHISEVNVSSAVLNKH